MSAVLCDLLTGLHAAHKTNGDGGESLGIIHRDVNPENVLVGLEGSARVVDFGVAKAIGRLQVTREGQVKGKIAYMAGHHSALLMTSAKNRALDVFRRERTARKFAPGLQHLIESEWTLRPTVEELFLPPALKDHELRMMFSCCHPHLAEEAQVALILNMLCGFAVEEIAHIYLATDAAIAKRISRGKKILGASQRLFELAADDFAPRLAAVHRALYLLFSEGYHGACAEPVIRAELCREAMRLIRLLVDHAPAATSATHALAALMYLDAARLPGRIDELGELIVLSDQDRSRWDATSPSRSRRSRRAPLDTRNATETFDESFGNAGGVRIAQRWSTVVSHEAHMNKMKLKPGVIAGSALQETFAYAKSVGCALPAVNVIGSHSAIAALQAAREAKSPIVIQFSNTGAQFFAGKFLDNKQQQASIAGAVAGAQFVRNIAEAYGVPVIVHTDHAAKKLLPWVEGLLDRGDAFFAKHGEPLFSSHMLDLSEEPLHENLEISSRVLRRMSPMKMTLEIELGVTGGEEDGIDNAGVDNSRLYTQPSEVLAAYDALEPIGSFTVAAAFGNTHGVYKPGNVKLRPVILKNSQEAIQRERKTAAKPVDFVFHGGSGSTRDEIREAVSYGVVKMNIDTDVQWAFCEPIRKYMEEKGPFLQAQLGNPEGPDEPNKKYIDPRGWLHLGEKGMVARLVEAFKDLNSFGQFDF